MKILIESDLPSRQIETFSDFLELRLAYKASLDNWESYSALIFVRYRVSSTPILS